MGAGDSGEQGWRWAQVSPKSALKFTWPVPRVGPGRTPGGRSHFTAGRGLRLFNQASPLSGVEKSRRQEMTTRAGQQPLSWGHRGLGTILGTYTGPFSCPETYREARANSSRLQAGRQAQGSARNECLSWASSLALLCAHPAL
ncbi:unnamed protein product [Rangifer tarandus platyrhynchus]|uniref:Uncharacterized protein n=1 Tax=Rangifer tarandus platyrhynchus TaxID=3082113 RepID=A0AC59YG57_RANTA